MSEKETNTPVVDSAESQIVQPKSWVSDASNMVTDGVGVLFRFLTTLTIFGGALLTLLLMKWFDFESTPWPTVTVMLTFVTLIVLWWSGRRKDDEVALAQIAKLQKQLFQMQGEMKKLEDRVTDAELVEAFEDRLARKQLDEQSLPKAEAFPPKVTSAETPETSSAVSSAERDSN